MNLESLVAIDVHTLACKSALRVDDAPTESQVAMGRYFRYQPQHQTVPEMAALYRSLGMAFVVFTVDRLDEKGISNEEIAELAHQNGDVAIPFARVEKRATVEDLEGLYAHLEEAAVASGFMAPQSRLRERWRRLFSRVPALEREEVNILRGLLKALLK